MRRAADRDAALSVDAPGGQVVAVLRMLAVLRMFAGERQSGAKNDDFFARWSRADGHDKEQSGAERRQPQPVRSA